MASLFKSLINFLCFILLNLIVMGTNAQNQIKRNELLNAKIGQRTVSEVRIVEIEFPAGQKAPYHKHPCPVLGSIITGTCLIQVEGENPKILKAGEAFYEPANRPILHFDNFSDTEPMKFTAYYLSNGELNLTELLPEKKADNKN